MRAQELAPDRSLTSFDDRSFAPESLGLDERITLVRCLLPWLRSLTPTDLRRLAVHLRALANVSEAWATRGEEASQDDWA